MDNKLDIKTKLVIILNISIAFFDIIIAIKTKKFSYITIAVLQFGIASLIYLYSKLLIIKNIEIDELMIENAHYKNQNYKLSRKINVISKDKIRKFVNDNLINISGFECVAIEDIFEFLEVQDGYNNKEKIE